MHDGDVLRRLAQHNGAIHGGVERLTAARPWRLVVWVKGFVGIRQGSDARQRARSKAEMRRGAIEKLGLNNTYKFDEVLSLASRKRPVDELTDEIHAATATENAEDTNADEDGTRTTRSFVCEQQRLQCPATSDPGTKLKFFHDQIVELSTPSSTTR